MQLSVNEKAMCQVLSVVILMFTCKGLILTAKSKKKKVDSLHVLTVRCIG